MHTGAVTVRAAIPADHDTVRGLLTAPLAALYPGGAQWLDIKLALAGAPASAVTVTVATLPAADGPDDVVVGTVICVPKPDGTVKVGALYVAAAHRRRGVGRALLRHTRVLHPSKARYITVAHHLSAEVEPVLRDDGFEHLSTVADRYGPSRHEAVYLAGAATHPMTHLA